MRAIADAAAGAERGPGWFARAAAAAADVAGARRAAFWRLQADGTLAVEGDPFGFDERQRGLLKPLAVTPSSAGIPPRVVFRGEEFVGPVESADQDDAYLALLRAAGVRVHAVVPWQLGSRTLGMVAVYDTRDDEFAADALPALRAAGVATALIAELQESQARQITAAEAEERRSKEVALIERGQQLEELKGDFLNVAAHELRSPLGILRGYVSMLREESLPAEHVPRVLKLLEAKTDEMARLIDEMLETAAVEDVNVRLSRERVDLLDIIDTALAAMEPLLGEPHRLVVRGLREPLPLTGDRRRLTTALTNLIDNAIKYSPDGGDIEVGWDARDNHVVLSVTDHGIGIRQEDVSDLFRRFGRIVTAENSHIRGSGLGLYLAREIIHRHDGDITVHSTPGEGTIFIVDLPLVAEPSKAP